MLFSIAWCLIFSTFAIGSFVPAIGKTFADEDPRAAMARAQAEAIKRGSESKPGDSSPSPPGNAKPGDAKPGDAKPGEENKEGGAESSQPKIVRRDGLEVPEGDPAELKATLGDDGKVGFQFRNQGWVSIIGWLSDIADEPIDWQELPGDLVNLVSPGRLDVRETSDLINRHLLSRGYTMLQLDGGITIVKTDAINPGMVHRVDPDELKKLPDHTFVRTMLDAGWLSAEKLSEELKAMLSGAGKITPLATTNRIEIMDAAVNLRQVASLLSEERDAASRDALAPEFRLQHIPAEEAKRLLEEFLGVKKDDPSPMSREQIQMMQRMQQQQQGKPPEPDQKIEISIVANVRQNSVLVRAPIDRVAVAAEFLKRIDVPGGSLRSLADASARVEVFRLVSLDPEKLIEIAQEMNVLEPNTRIRVDKDNSAIIVSGAAADRFIIKSLIERLDGGKRRFEVLQLRRLEPAEVAESIAFLMGQKDEKEDSGNNRRSYYYGFGGNDDDKDEEKDEFRVAANTRYRQVLLWANEAEMEEVRTLLMKLGELPPPGGSGRMVRTIEASTTPETLEYLKQLKAQWQSMSGNELVLPEESEFVDPIEEAKRKVLEDAEKDAESEGTESVLPDPPAKVSEDDVELTQRAYRPSGDETATTLTVQNSSPKQAASNPTASKPPIEIRIDSEGNLVLSSQDTQALDQLENLMLEIKPPRRPYHVFQVQHASVTLLTLDLEEYFEEDEDKDDSSADNFYRWYFGDGDDDKKKSPTGLAKTGKLRFLANSDTNTIIVSGASAEQLRTIEELIRLWDVPEPVNSKRSRYTKLVTIQYGRAEKIADTVKDAYRDLLSSNDKAFAGGKQGQKNVKRSSNREEGSGLEDSESGQSGGGNDFSFNGKLSLGVDEIGNTIVVSAEGESLLNLIVSMIDKLDQAAMPGGEIEIVRLSGDVSAETLRQAMATLGAAAEVTSEKSESSSRDRDRRRSSRD
ncbi:secretin N-terminal domain-containing protein [Neorhodopirellula pilleata]|uniref:secretin N-terminal domain-containing protein n=1 Tax=Neorhodopirellula pilleata TaxID=2714738 RepID=UPI0036F1AAE0